MLAVRVEEEVPRMNETVDTWWFLEGPPALYRYYRRIMEHDEAFIARERERRAHRPDDCADISPYQAAGMYRYYVSLVASYRLITGEDRQELRGVLWTLQVSREQFDADVRERRKYIGLYQAEQPSSGRTR